MRIVSRAFWALKVRHWSVIWWFLYYCDVIGTIELCASMMAEARPRWPKLQCVLGANTKNSGLNRSSARKYCVIARRVTCILPQHAEFALSLSLHNGRVTHFICRYATYVIGVKVSPGDIGMYIVHTCISLCYSWFKIMDSVGRNGMTLNIQRAPFINRNMPTTKNWVDVFNFVCCVDSLTVDWHRRDAINAELPIAEVAPIGAHIFIVDVQCSVSVCPHSWLSSFWQMNEKIQSNF